MTLELAPGFILLQENCPWIPPRSRSLTGRLRSPNEARSSRRSPGPAATSLLAVLCFAGLPASLSLLGTLGLGILLKKHLLFPLMTLSLLLGLWEAVKSGGTEAGVLSLCEACGEEGAGSARKSRAKPSSRKQEVSFVPVWTGMSKSDGTGECRHDQVLRKKRLPPGRSPPELGRPGLSGRDGPPSRLHPKSPGDRLPPVRDRGAPLPSAGGLKSVRQGPGAGLRKAWKGPGENPRS